MLNPFTHRKVLAEGVPGQARIVAHGALDRGASSFNLPMTLQVYVQGWTPYEVEDQWMVKARDTIGLSSGVIPVRVDPDEPRKVAIDWDGVRAAHEQQETARRQALAAQGPVDDPAAAAMGMGAAPVADAQGVTPTIDLRNDPELRAKLEAVLGRKLTPGSTETVAANDPMLQMRIMQVVQEHMAQRAAAPPTPAEDDREDPATRLEKLAQLRDAGLVTEADFQAKKAEILADL